MTFNQQTCLSAGIDADIVTVLNAVIQRYGGIEGLMKQFAHIGSRPTFKSWVLTGANRPVTAEQIQNAVGPPLMCEMAAKVGLSPQTLAIRLAFLLPSAIDLVTPHGRSSHVKRAPVN